VEDMVEILEDGKALEASKEVVPGSESNRDSLAAVDRFDTHINLSRAGLVNQLCFSSHSRIDLEGWLSYNPNTSLAHSAWADSQCQLEAYWHSKSTCQLDPSIGAKARGDRLWEEVLLSELPRDKIIRKSRILKLYIGAFSLVSRDI
jgi:hypothetical protein